MTDLTIRNDEQIVFSLRSLYECYGYTQFKMTKFEEYDLYVKNKDYLLSDNIITFNDTNGRLMALKPDVTLSIIKNSDDEKMLHKVYYNENVYRVSKSSNTYKEIMQVGLECIGDIDDYCLSEVLSLAAESLKSISDKCVLSVSNINILSGVLKNENVDSDAERKIFDLISKKNMHELAELCEGAGISEDSTEKLFALISVYGKPDEVFPKLNKLFPNNADVENFEKIISSLNDDIKDIIEIDFSMADDSKYYNGITFKGFVMGIAGSVLSGGQYDNLMKKMNKKSKAIGFAIYLDMLERLNETVKEYDIDTVLLYEDDADIKKLNEVIGKITFNGASVLAVKTVPEKIKYRRLMKFNGKEAICCEGDA